MAKQRFQKLSRGVKLLKEHIYTPVASTLDNLTDTDFTGDGGVESDQIKHNKAPFTLHFSLPAISPEKPFVSIPFTLPAHQQDTSWSTGNYGQETPIFDLTDVGIGLDTRDEVAGIRAPGATDPNKIDYVENERYKLNVSILETRQTSQGNLGLQETRFNTVWSATIPGNFIGAGLNPGVFEEINAELKPLITYVLLIEAPEIVDVAGAGAKNLIIPSLNVWLKMNSTLVTRDIHDPASGQYVQNIPTDNDGKHRANIITATPPPGTGDLISANYDTASADPYDGVQTAIRKIDSLFQNKLKSGYNVHSELPFGENIIDDSGYTIIAVPMWSAISSDITETNVGNLPYTGVFPYTGHVCDRRIIPLNKPFTVHHVIAATGYGKDAKAPSSPTFTHSVGVGIGSGLRGDRHTYQQVAQYGWNPAFGPPATSADFIPYLITSTSTDSWELVGVPLVAIIGQTSNNYGTQGKPFFIGQARTGTDARTNVGDGSTGSPPNTLGQENFLEVRWSIQDSAGLANVPANEVMLQAYGSWVYIIGKQTLSE